MDKLENTLFLESLRAQKVLFMSGSGLSTQVVCSIRVCKGCGGDTYCFLRGQVYSLPPILPHLIRGHMVRLPEG